MNNGRSQNCNNLEPAGKWWKNPFVILVPVFFIGVVDLVSALRRHDEHEAIAVSAIFFLLVPVAVFACYFVRRISK